MHAERRRRALGDPAQSPVLVLQPVLVVSRRVGGRAEAVLPAPAQQGVPAVRLGQFYPSAIGGGLEDGHHGLQHPQGVCAAALVVAVTVQGPDVFIHEAVIVLGGPPASGS